MTSASSSLKEKFAIALISGLATANAIGYVVWVKPVQGAVQSDRAQLAEMTTAIATFPPIRGMK